MRRIWLLVVALIVPAACQPASGASDPAADEAAIRSVLQGLETTWNAGDLDAHAEYVDSDMVSLPPGEPWIRGAPARGARSLSPVPTRTGSSAVEVIVFGGCS